MHICLKIGVYNTEIEQIINWLQLKYAMRKYIQDEQMSSIIDEWMIDKDALN